MRKIILGLAISLDGFIEGPNGEYDWCFTDQDYGMSEFFKRIDAIFYGRKSYELTLSMGESAMPGFPKLTEYVFSNSMQKVKPGVNLVSGNIQNKVNQVKQEIGKDIWLFGGASLTASLMNLRLVDEIWLSVHPIILGAGKALFNNTRSRIPLKLIDSKTYSTGLISLKYEL